MLGFYFRLGLYIRLLFDIRPKCSAPVWHKAYKLSFVRWKARMLAYLLHVPQSPNSIAHPSLLTRGARFLPWTMLNKGEAGRCQIFISLIHKSGMAGTKLNYKVRNACHPYFEGEAALKNLSKSAIVLGQYIVKKANRPLGGAVIGLS